MPSTKSLVLAAALATSSFAAEVPLVTFDGADDTGACAHKSFASAEGGAWRGGGGAGLHTGRSLALTWIDPQICPPRAAWVGAGMQGFLCV